MSLSCICCIRNMFPCADPCLMNAWCWQVNIDAQGLLKVVHMVKLQNSADHEGFQAVSAYSESQASPSFVSQICM